LNFHGRNISIAFRAPSARNLAPWPNAATTHG
jgi:hypothetical protein